MQIFQIFQKKIFIKLQATQSRRSLASWPNATFGRSGRNGRAAPPVARAVRRRASACAKTDASARDRRRRRAPVTRKNAPSGRSGRRGAAAPPLAAAGCVNASAIVVPRGSFVGRDLQAKSKAARSGRVRCGRNGSNGRIAPKVVAEAKGWVVV